jgi:O-antigen/teichoic acid export membrane protein
LPLASSVSLLFIARAVVVLVNFLLIPLYLSKYGQSTLGLMTLLVSVIAIAAVLDLGICTKASVSAAQLRLNPKFETARQFLHAGETFYWYAGFFIGLLCVVYVVTAPNNWIWTVIQSESPAGWHLSVLCLTALYIFFGWLQVFYTSSLTGLEANRLLCFSTITFAISRLVLVFFASRYSDNLFFVFLAHVTCSGCQVFFSRVIFSHYVQRKYFWCSPQKLFHEIKKAINPDLVVIGIAATYLTHIDKVVLSVILPPDEFASYSVAAMLASGLYLVINPLFSSLVPYFTRLIAINDEDKLREKYSYASELASFLTIPPAMILIFFSQDLLNIWLGNAETARQADQVLAWLVAGTLANGFVCIAYALQIAAGWTSLAKKINVALALFILPCLWLAVSTFGIQGAAATWTVLNIVLLLIWPALMHKKLIRYYALNWLLRHFVIPCVLVGLTAFFCSEITKYFQLTGFVLLIAITASFIFASGVAFLSTVQIKSNVTKYLNTYLN